MNEGQASGQDEKVTREIQSSDLSKRLAHKIGERFLDYAITYLRFPQILYDVHHTSGRYANGAEPGADTTGYLERRYYGRGGPSRAYGATVTGVAFPAAASGGPYIA